MKKIIFSFLILLISFEVNAQNKINEIVEKIQGKWISEYSIKCSRTNPPQIDSLSEGYSKTLWFDKNRVKELRDNSVYDESKFEIREIGNRWLFFDSNLIVGNISIQQDTLSISSCSTDGQYNRFVRIKKR